MEPRPQLRRSPLGCVVEFSMYISSRTPRHSDGVSTHDTYHLSLMDLPDSMLPPACDHRGACGSPDKGRGGS